MTKVRPYLLPRPGRVQTTGWYWLDQQAKIKLPEIITTWDPGTVLRCQNIIVLHVSGVFKDCGLGDDAALRITAVWSSPGTKLTGTGSSVLIEHSTGKRQFEVSVTVPGYEIAHDVTVGVKLTLESCGGNFSAIAPRLRGMVLWEDAYRVRVEGSGSRFPIEAIDFSETPLGPRTASWRLQFVDEDLRAHPMSGMQLFLNAGNVRLGQILTDSEDAEKRSILLDTIKYDVAMSIVARALNSDEFIEEPGNFGVDTIASVARHILSLMNPHKGLEVFAIELKERPDKFKADLQAALSLFALKERTG